jgi:hypothetical protein
MYIHTWKRRTYNKHYKQRTSDLSGVTSE